jgi:hypothetical protein
MWLEGEDKFWARLPHTKNKINAEFWRFWRWLWHSEYFVSGLCPPSGILTDWKTRFFGNWMCSRLQVRKGKHQPSCAPWRGLTATEAPHCRQSRREETRKCAVKIAMEHANYGRLFVEWNYDASRHYNLCHKSIQQAKSLTPMFKSKSKLHYDRQSVGQSVLVSGTRDQIFPHLSLIILRQLRVCWCGALSDGRTGL